MSCAPNDDLTVRLVTRTDLDQAVTSLQADIGALGVRVGTLEGTVNERFEGVDAKIEGVDAKMEALRSQNRYVFLVLALIAGLDFYNRVAPHVADKDTPPDAPNRAEPAAQLPTTGSNRRIASGT